MDAKYIPFLCAIGAILIVIALGIAYVHDVSGYVSSLIALFMGHHAVFNANGLPAAADPSDDGDDSPKIVPAVFTPPVTSNPSISLKTTRYGKSKKAKGWDGKGDRGTDAGLGAWNNQLTNDACALTESARKALGANRYDSILLTWSNGRTMKVRYEDIAPEDDERCDIYLPWKDDPTIPDYGVAQVIASDAVV